MAVRLFRKISLDTTIEVVNHCQRLLVIESFMLISLDYRDSVKTH